MRTVLLGDRPPVVDEWLRLRRERGQNLFDEVWEGEYHVAPAPKRRHGVVDDQIAQLLGPLARAAGLQGSGPCNIGTPPDYRVPDRAHFREAADLTWSPTAAIVVEVVSPDDETWAKLAFYHRVGVEEMIIADPEARSVTILARARDAFEHVQRSAILEIGAEQLLDAIDWPA